ncbi:uncharacterized protein LOC118349872 [Juglans regia]|uniref:Uncharacterized protein LOC118349872 n=1 Tax=Juglans regia TaxID=51240 RepID=A0A6P9F725_JUGRE|nr:uncharacterized protein LOC118349872 [Juglans regia]
MQDMLDDIRAGTFNDAPQDSTPAANRPRETVDSPSFEQLLDDARRPLFDGCTKFSKLSFVVKLLHIKSIGGWSIKSFDMLLDLLRSAFPDALLPQSYEESRSLERGLGFKYHKIHACPNDCILFWKENTALNECPVCKASRWIPNTHGLAAVPQKVLRHFLLKPRLQRLFMSAKIAGDMRWHKEQQTEEDTCMRHPADSECWKKFDEDHGWFASDPRNVRLGLVKLACPSCNADTDSNWLKYGRKHCYMGHRRFLPPDHIWRRRKWLFNGREDHRRPPREFGPEEIQNQLQMIGDVEFGKSHRKKKRTAEELNWTKCSIFFVLPYWSTMRLRHNLDVMHIEKNIADNILFTLMNSPGKSKDNINSRRDLELLGYRKELHLIWHGDRMGSLPISRTVYLDVTAKSQG